uniref:Ig-like domain-containing protein n=1 Tax=Strigops habroptila TaxID=2489341 RepID=A0A672URN0_STRHB
MAWAPLLLAALTQPSSVSAAIGEKVQITCSGGGNWYGWYQLKVPAKRPSGIPLQFSGSKSKSGTTDTLTITGVQAKDEAVCYCGGSDVIQKPPAASGPGQCPPSAPQQQGSAQHPDQILILLQEPGTGSTTGDKGTSSAISWHATYFQLCQFLCPHERDRAGAKVWHKGEWYCQALNRAAGPTGAAFVSQELPVSSGAPSGLFSSSVPGTVVCGRSATSHKLGPGGHGCTEHPAVLRGEGCSEIPVRTAPGPILLTHSRLRSGC